MVLRFQICVLRCQKAADGKYEPEDGREVVFEISGIEKAVDENRGEGGGERRGLGVAGEVLDNAIDND